MTTCKENLANPGPVGLCGFALTTWLLSLVNGGFFIAQEGIGLVLGMALAFGGTAQIIAGTFEYKKGNTFGFTAFISYGAFWWSWALFTVFFKGETAAAFIGWYLCVWGMFSLMMFVATLTKPKVLTLTFFALGIGDGMQNHSIVHIGGYLGLVTALGAFYLAAAEVINESFGKTVLPVGERK